jgi:hypothetical protein
LSLVLTKSGQFGVAQVSNLLYRRFPIGSTLPWPAAPGLSGQPRSKTFGDGVMVARQRFGVRLSPAAFPADSHI